MAIRRILIVVVGLSCLGCRAADSPSPQDAGSPTGDPPTVGVQVGSSARDTVVYAYYFHRTFRCISCQTMEEMAARTIGEHFARQMQDGQVVWMPVNVDDPQTQALQRQLDVRSNGLVLARVEKGMYKDSKSLDRLWGLLGRPDDFSKCVIDEVNACLGGAQGR